MAAGDVRIYILCGLSFAGKSTLGRHMAQQLGCRLVQLDVINDEFGAGIAGAPITPQQWDATYCEFHSRLFELLRGGTSVIADAGNFTREQREVLRDLAKEAGAGATVVYVKVADDVAIARWQLNRLQPGRADVRDENFAFVMDNFEPPESEENVLIYDGSLKAKDWVRKNLL